MPITSTLFGVLWGWTFITVAVTAVIGIGVGVMSMTPPEFLVAKICFSFAALLLTMKTAEWLVTEPSSVGERMVVGFLLFGVIGTVWIGSIYWVKRREPQLAKNGQPQSSSPVVTNIFLFRDLRRSRDYAPPVGSPPVIDRYHLVRITFSKSGKWSSENVAVYLLTGGTNYPFDFIAPKKFRVRDDQIGPTEIVAEIFRVNSNWLATEPGSSPGPAELTLEEAVPDRYRLFSLTEGKDVILKIGVSVNNELLKTESILVRPIKKQETATGRDLWDVIFEKAN